ncbi:glycosyltransferase family 9 protein [Thermodesulfobacteriota bacterium]
MGKSFKKILLVRLSAIGDVVNALPSVSVIRDVFPDASISWLVEDRASDLLRHHPGLDNLFVFERRRIQSNMRNPCHWISGIREALSLIRSLRRTGFDLAVDFHGNLKSGVLTWLSGAGTRIGYSRRFSREGNFLFMNSHVSPPAGPILRVERYMSLLAPLGVSQARPSADLPELAETAGRIEQIFKDADLQENRFVVLHPGTSTFGSIKRWPAHYYASLGDRIMRELDLPVVLTHGPGELHMAESVRTGMKAPAFISPSLSLAEMSSLLRRTLVFIGADTGPMHMASALGVPVVGIYGPKDPVIYGPGFGSSRVARLGIPCSPCTKRSCDDPRCLTDLVPDMVFDEVVSLLDEVFRGT